MPTILSYPVLATPANVDLLWVTHGTAADRDRKVTIGDAVTAGLGYAIISQPLSPAILSGDMIAMENGGVGKRIDAIRFEPAHYKEQIPTSGAKSLQAYTGTPGSYVASTAVAAQASGLSVQVGVTGGLTCATLMAHCTVVSTSLGGTLPSGQTARFHIADLTNPQMAIFAALLGTWGAPVYTTLTVYGVDFAINLPASLELSSGKLVFSVYKVATGALMTWNDVLAIVGSPTSPVFMFRSEVMTRLV